MSTIPSITDPDARSVARRHIAWCQSEGMKPRQVGASFGALTWTWREAQQVVAVAWRAIRPLPHRGSR